MNILLCIPNAPHQVSGWSAPPIGTAYVSSSLKAAGHNVHCINFILEKRTVYDAMHSVINEHNIELVGAGNLVVNYTSIKEIIETAKKIKPGVTTFIGGGFVTHSPCEAMHLIPAADYGVLGEGEITVCELAGALETNKNISEVQSIAYREENGAVVITPERCEIPDLDAIPFPDYEGFNFGELIAVSGGYTSVVTARSCPFGCTFCSHSGGKRYRQRSLDSIFEEIDLLVRQYGADKFNFTDELFAVTSDRITEFSRRIAPYNIKFLINMRVSDILTENILNELKAAGCIQINYGIESADNRILKSMKKNITIEHIERCLKRTKKAGISSEGNFIFGDTAETMDTVNTTLQWVRKNHNLLRRIKFAPIILYPGAPLYDKAIRDGKIADTISHIERGCPALNVSRLSDDEYDKLVNEIIPQQQRILLESEHRLEFRPSPLQGAKGTAEDFVYDAVCRCEKCGTENHVPVRKKEIYMVRLEEVVCSCCNAESTINKAYSYMDWIEPEIEELITKNNCIIWGAGRFFTYVYERSHAFSDNSFRYKICDNAILRQNTLYFGNKVYSPDILSNEDIDVCLIVNIYGTEVKKEISARFPHIKALEIHELGMLKTRNED